MQKLVFLDVDGTLINSSQQAPRSAVEACQRAAQNGHKLFMCTGRSYPEVYPWLWDLGISGLVGANGTYVTCEDEVIFDERISDEDIIEISNFINSVGGYWIWQGPDRIMPSKEFLDSYSGAGADRIAGDWTPYLHQVAPYLKTGTPTSCGKCTFTLPPTASASLEDVIEHFGDRFTIVAGSVTAEGPEGGELVPANISKASGVRQVVMHLDIPLEQTIGIGDSANDGPMMKTVGTSIAMGNAIDEIKEISKWTTTSVDEDGIKNAFEYLKLI